MGSFKFHFSPGQTGRLEKRLEVLSKSTNLRWQQVKEVLSLAMNNRYAEVFPDFKGLASDHGEQGVGFLNATLPEDLLLSLQSAEMFTLMSACYIHDIGMFSEHEPFTQNEYFSHFPRGQEIILEREWLPFTEGERKVIGYMTRWHNYAQWVKHGSPQEPDVIIDEVKVRTHLLVQLLQLADNFHRIVDVTWKGFVEFSESGDECKKNAKSS